MKNRLAVIFILLMLAGFSFTACAPTAALQAQNSLGAASREAANQAASVRHGRKQLRQDTFRMRGDIKRIKEAERLFDSKSGIVLTY